MPAAMHATIPRARARRAATAMAASVGSGGGVCGGAVGLRPAFTAPVPPHSQNSPNVLLPTQKARRVAALVNLLESFHELRDSLRAGDGDTFGDGLLLAPHEDSCRLRRHGSRCTCVLSAVAELERLLAQMRTDEPRLRFHLVAWFVDAQHRGRWEPRPRAKRRRPWQPFVYRRFVVRDPRAEKRLALDGVRWLAERWELRDVRGELVEPHLVSPGFDAPIFERLVSGHSSPRAL